MFFIIACPGIKTAYIHITVVQNNLSPWDKCHHFVQFIIIRTKHWYIFNLHNLNSKILVWGQTNQYQLVCNLSTFSNLFVEVTTVSSCFKSWLIGFYFHPEHHSRVADCLLHCCCNQPVWSDILHCVWARESAALGCPHILLLQRLRQETSHRLFQLTPQSQTHLTGNLNDRRIPAVLIIPIAQLTKSE